MHYYFFFIISVQTPPSLGTKAGVTNDAVAAKDVWRVFGWHRMKNARIFHSITANSRKDDAQTMVGLRTMEAKHGTKSLKSYGETESTKTQNVAKRKEKRSKLGSVFVVVVVLFREK